MLACSQVVFAFTVPWVNLSLSHSNYFSLCFHVELQCFWSSSLSVELVPFSCGAKSSVNRNLASLTQTCPNAVLLLEFSSPWSSQSVYKENKNKNLTTATVSLPTPNFGNGFFMYTYYLFIYLALELAQFWSPGKYLFSLVILQSLLMILGGQCIPFQLAMVCFLRWGIVQHGFSKTRTFLFSLIWCLLFFWLSNVI